MSGEEPKRRRFRAKRTVRKVIVFTPVEDDEVQERAKQRGLEVARFIREAALGMELLPTNRPWAEKIIAALNRSAMVLMETRGKDDGLLPEVLATIRKLDGSI